VLERYVGEYQLMPGLVITVTRQDVHLRPAHRPAGIRGVRIGRDFFYKVVNAQLTFEVGATGPAVAVVLHQNGQYPRAPRIVR